MDFEKARFNMVDQQIRPWEVTNLKLLDVLNDIPREKFVLADQFNIAYAELNLPLKNGGIMLEPKLVARLIQSLELSTRKNPATVLEIGTGSGYATAILASLAEQVDTVDFDKSQSDFAKKVLDSLDIKNVNYLNIDGLKEADINSLNKKYDAIYIGGGLHEIPDFLKALLNPNGKLVAIVGETPIMKTIVISQDGTSLDTQSLFETSVPYLTEPITELENKFIF